MGKKLTSADPVVQLSVDLVATTAYYKAAERGFAPGNELADWLAAEREVAAMLKKASRAVRKKPATKKAASKRKTASAARAPASRKK
jgi:Protein of unknown function (DUF2934)